MSNVVLNFLWISLPHRHINSFPTFIGFASVGSAAEFDGSLSLANGIVDWDWWSSDVGAAMCVLGMTSYEIFWWSSDIDDSGWLRVLFLVNDGRWRQNEEDGGLEDGFFFSDPLNI